MTRRALSLFVLTGLVLTGSVQARVSGSYLEARTSDVYTGPCFANGEVNLTGHEAILAWQVDRGIYQDVVLDGQSVVAVVQASATLGDPHESPLPARSVVLVDESASAEQEAALVALVQELGGELLAEEVHVQRAPIHLTVDHASSQGVLKAGDLAELKTRALCMHDVHCGNESVYYPPLTEVDEAIPAYTVAHAYRGQDLEGTWSCPAKRSAFLAKFTR